LIKNTPIDKDRGRRAHQRHMADFAPGLMHCTSRGDDVTLHRVSPDRRSLADQRSAEVGWPWRRDAIA
jgi:hypothetical protein